MSNFFFLYLYLRPEKKTPFSWYSEQIKNFISYFINVSSIYNLSSFKEWVEMMPSTEQDFLAIFLVVVFFKKKKKRSNKRSSLHKVWLDAILCFNFNKLKKLTIFYIIHNGNENRSSSDGYVVLFAVLELWLTFTKKWLRFDREQYIRLLLIYMTVAWKAESSKKISMKSRLSLTMRSTNHSRSFETSIE
jgi:hypothetical protein